MELWIPYGGTEIPVRVPDDNFFRILEPAKTLGAKNPASMIEAALEKPLGEVFLRDVVKPGSAAGIIIDPIVPVDVRDEALKALRSRLTSVGIDQVRVFMRKRLSNVVFGAEDLKMIDPAQSSFVELGKTSAGTSLELDPDFAACDVKINVGLVMPHFASGFTGGPEAVLPGSSSIHSIARNRSLLTKGFPAFSSTPDNQVLLDSLEAVKLAGPFYSLCFMPDGVEGVTSAFAGELESVFREAVSRYQGMHSPKIERKLDIVIVSAGSLLGSDLYHAIRVVSNVLGALKREGTVILVAECPRGVGDSNFLEYARKFPERKELSTELRYRFKLGGHLNLFLQEALEKCRIQLVSILPELFVRDTFGLKPSQTASEAVQKAIRVEGKESKILIVPRGDFTIPVMES
ncbi:MAG TPA: lactate racemase domain-containing protein [Candidatus Angelobacter sp.]|nr:lactate racemase domain-containing protein [Candidatus Angelobacter sp.]